MKHDYSVGDDVPLSFQVLVNAKPITPFGAWGYVFDAKSKLIDEGSCQIKGSNVSYKVNAKKITEPGEYTAIFKVKLRIYGVKAYPLKFTVRPLPVKKAIRDKIEKKTQKPPAPKPKVMLPR